MGSRGCRPTELARRVLWAPGMRTKPNHNPPASTQPYFLRDHVDAYWAAIEIHAVLMLSIPQQRGIGAARQRIDRCFSQAVLAVGKAANGREQHPARFLERAEDALDTVLIALDDMTALGHVSLALRENARTWIAELLGRLTELGALPINDWADTSKPRGAWAVAQVGAAAVAPVSLDAAEGAAGKYSLGAVLSRCETEAAALRRTTELNRAESEPGKDVPV